LTLTMKRMQTQTLWELGEDGEVSLRLHKGQARAWKSNKRFVLMLAGTQGGKTAFGPWWLYREIKRLGAGDYLAVTTSYDLFMLKMLPEMLRVFVDVLGIGKWWGSSRTIEIAHPDEGFLASISTDTMWGRIILRSITAESGLEAATVRAAWLDECGQKEWTIDVWEAILRRLSLSQGRVLGTTTVYTTGWLKNSWYDKWVEGDPHYDVVQFSSLENPAFPHDEFERARRELPDWRFRMFYKGEFTKPEGLIYDSFSPERHTCRRFDVPASWPRYLGIDFGGKNMAALCYAEDPGTGLLYCYREYLEGDKTIAEHVKDITNGEDFDTCVGGAASEGQWRDEFAHAGLIVRKPSVGSLEVGIQRVYSAHKRNEIIYFRDLIGILDEKSTYSRRRDRTGAVIDDIAEKNAYHRLDAERYIISEIRGGLRLDYSDFDSLGKIEDYESRWA